MQSLSSLHSPSILSVDLLSQSKLPHGVCFWEVGNGLLWCSVTPKGVRNVYSWILLPKKTAQQTQVLVLSLLPVTESALMVLAPC